MSTERDAGNDESGAEAGTSGHMDHGDVAPLTAELSGSPDGRDIGPYHLLELIGEGGMGQVWLTEQRQPVRRRVALKLIKSGMDTREVVARFESERQALALMDHPAIAKVFDAGSTRQGRPYFVMEYVAGLPITDYCDKHKLTTRQRLELIVRVCEGVQHAHQKAIIHRDLKPSNILVTEVDGKPMPRIIDFGVAKAVTPLTAETMFTQRGAIVGTVGYMSPEQADSGGRDIDTRTDVYSLGVVLYELLVGALPLELEKLGYLEMLRLLREQEVPAPSTRLRTLGGASASTAENRGADVPALARQLRGDADAIALKALEKDRKRRYASPAELAADIERHLRNEPVVAHAPSAMYRIRKYIRRHRLAVAVGVVGVSLLVGFVVAQAMQLRRVRRERDRADRIAEFMTQIFKVSEPGSARGNTVTAREVLDQGAQQIDSGLKGDPELQAKMMSTMADTYIGLGVFPEAQSLLERALDYQRRELGTRNADTLQTMGRLSLDLADQGKYAEAEKLDRETLALDRKALGPKSSQTLLAMNYLGFILAAEGHYAEAETMQRNTLNMERKVLGPTNRDTLDSGNDLGTTLFNEGKFAEAEGFEREAIEDLRQAGLSNDPIAITAASNLMQTLNSEGRLAEAEALGRQTLDSARRIWGPDHENVTAITQRLAQILASEGRYPEAEKLLQDALEIETRERGAEAPTTWMLKVNVGLMLAHQERYAEAESLFRGVLEGYRRLYGASDARTVYIEEELGVILAHRGNYSEAAKLFREAIASADKTDRQLLAAAWYNFACAAAITAHRDDALDYLGRAVALGYSKEYAATDSDLKSLHNDKRFDALIGKERERAVAKTQ